MRNETKYGRKGIIGALYEKYAAKAKAYFGACLHNEMVAEDLTQDLFPVSYTHLRAHET